MRLRVLGIVLVAALGALAAGGCYTSPPTDTPPDGRLRERRLTETLAEADRFLAADDPDQAYQWYDHASLLDARRTADVRIAEGKIECARRLAIDGTGVDMFGLVPDRRQGIKWLLEVARDYRFTDAAPKALFFAAMAYRIIDEPDVAVLAAERLIREHPESVWAEAAELERVLALLTATRAIDYDGQPLAEAQWRLEMYGHLHPAGVNRATAAEKLRQVRDYRAEKDYRTARWYDWREHAIGARYYYEEITREYPGTLWAELAGQRLRAMGPAPVDADDTDDAAGADGESGGRTP